MVTHSLSKKKRENIVIRVLFLFPFRVTLIWTQSTPPHTHCSSSRICVCDALAVTTDCDTEISREIQRQPWLAEAPRGQGGLCSPSEVTNPSVLATAIPLPPPPLRFRSAAPLFSFCCSPSPSSSLPSSLFSSAHARTLTSRLFTF